MILLRNNCAQMSCACAKTRCTKWVLTIHFIRNLFIINISRFIFNYLMFELKSYKYDSYVFDLTKSTPISAVSKFIRLNVDISSTVQCISQFTSNIVKWTIESYPLAKHTSSILVLSTYTIFKTLRI